jgi:flagellar biogenesis protein FliO
MPLSYYVQVILSLCILLAILYGVLKFSKRIQKVKYSGEIEIIDRRVIDNGVALVMVSVHDKNFLLSVSGQTVQVIDKYEKTT